MNSSLVALRESLDATSVVSSHYRSHIIMLAEAAWREAFEAGQATRADEETVRAEQRAATLREAADALRAADEIPTEPGEGIITACARYIEGLA